MAGEGDGVETTTDIFRLEDVTPPTRPSPPTAQTTYGKAFKFGRNVWYWNTFGVIQAIFEILSQTQNIAKNPFLAKVVKNIVFLQYFSSGIKFQKSL